MRHPRRTDQTFSQRIGRQAVGAVQAGRGAFADGKKAGHGGPAVNIGGDTAHVVVRGRGHRNGLDTRVDAGALAGREDCGETIRESLADGLAAIQEGAFSGRVLAMHGPGDDIARGEFGIVVDRFHEAMAGLVDQGRAFPAQGFGTQRGGVETGIEGGGVELHEFGIADHRAQTRRHRHGLALGDGRRGGQGKQAAGAAHGEQGGVGVDALTPAIRALGKRAGTGARIAQQGHSFPAIPDLDVVGGADSRDQRRHDRRAGAIAVHAGDPVPAMGGFARQRPVLARALEGGAQCGQVGDFRCGPLGEGFGGPAIHQPGTGRDRVARMQGWRIIGCQCGRNPALGPAGSCALTERRTGEQDHLARGELQCRPEPGNPGTTDEDGAGHDVARFSPDPHAFPAWSGQSSRACPAWAGRAWPGRKPGRLR